VIIVIEFLTALVQLADYAGFEPPQLSARIWFFGEHSERNFPPSPQKYENRSIDQLISNIVAHVELVRL
jgi:hypothetical protein